MSRIARSCAVVAIMLVATSGVSAQAPAAGSAACSDASSNKNLTDKLKGSGGVICPPNIDSAIKAPTPPTGDQPVIPPPGSPGGNPNVQPK